MTTIPTTVPKRGRTTTPTTVPKRGRTTTPTTVPEGGQTTTMPTTVPEGGRTTTMPTTAIENENEPCKPGKYSFEQCPSPGNVLRCINKKCIKTDKGGPDQPCLPGKSDLEKCPAYEFGKCRPSGPNRKENYCSFPMN